MKHTIGITLMALLLLLATPLWAHGSFEQHKEDMYKVLAFKENKQLTAWMRLISSSLIDNAKGSPRSEYNGLAFYDYLKATYPPFKCKHRILFHWGYNARPWSDELDKKMKQCKFSKATIAAFQQTLAKEQQYRNRKANAQTEKVFGFASGGQDAAYANAMVSLVYDIHLLGDYTPDNRDLDGVATLTSIVGDVINSLRKLDAKQSKTIVQNVSSAAKRTDLDVQHRAERILNVLARDFPKFFQSAEGGALVKRFKKKGIVCV